MSVSVITLDGNPVNLVALPAYPGLQAVEFTGFDGIGLVRKPFTGGGAQAQQWHGGDMWSGKATMPMMTQSPNADNWLAFLEELRGMSNAFQLGDPLQPNARGSGAGRPRVDNNAAGGNAPGSLTLSTRGWTANAVGVLLAGDYIQLGYRLYRCLDNITADADGNAVVPIWPCLREQPFDDGTAGGWVNASGRVGFTISRSLGNNGAPVMWSNFFYTSAPLPGDAVIQGIYPVIVISGTFDIAFQYVQYGYGLTYGDTDPPSGTPFPTPSGMPWQTGESGASFASTVAWGPSLGTDLATVMPNFNIQIQLASTLNEPPPPNPGALLTDNMTATQVGLAIYYTSATPATDIQMAPPFTVPSGQGVSFALPLTVEQLGGFGDGGFGFLELSTGYAVGIGAVNNGLLQLNNTKGIWRLASNKRDWKSDFDRLTAPQFPFQEYR